MALPVVESFTSNSATSSTLTIAKPSGVQVGDLLLIIVANDNTTTTPQWNNTSQKPFGFELIQTIGNNLSDSHIAAFYRIADGSESSTFSTFAQSSNDYVGWCLRISSVDSSNPINIVGSASINASTPLTPPAVTTSENDCLAFYLAAGDGADTLPYSEPAGWTEGDELGLAGSVGVGAAWGTKAMPSADSTGSPSINMTSSDGNASFLFAIKGSSLQPVPIVSQSFVSTPGITTTTDYLNVFINNIYDEYYDNVVTQVDFEETYANGRYIDKSSNPLSVIAEFVSETAGATGNVALLTNSNDAGFIRVEAESNTTFDISNTFTYEMYFQIPEASESYSEVQLLNLGDGETTEDYIFLFAGKNGSIYELQIISQSAVANTGFGDTVFDQGYIANVETGQWYHVAMQRDENDVFSVFVDGVEEYSKANTQGTYEFEGFPLYIGGTVNVAADQIRYTVGTARYANTGFTPPENPYQLNEVIDKRPFSLSYVGAANSYLSLPALNSSRLFSAEVVSDSDVSQPSLGQVHAISAGAGGLGANTKFAHDFESNTGNVFDDVGDYGYDATMSGSNTFTVTGITGNTAIYIPGNEGDFDDFIEVNVVGPPQTNTWTISNTFTFETYFNVPDGFTNFNPVYLYYAGLHNIGEEFPAGSFYMYVTEIFGDYELYATYYYEEPSTGDGWEISVYNGSLPANTFSANTWHHVAMQWNDASTYDFFVDGVNVSNGSIDIGNYGLSPGTMDVNLNLLLGGTWENGANSAVTGNFDDIIYDHVRFVENELVYPPSGFTPPNTAFINEPGVFEVSTNSYTSTPYMDRMFPEQTFSNSYTDNATFGQVHALTSEDIFSISTTSEPFPSTGGSLFAEDIVSQSYTDAATLGQTHELTSEDIVSSSTVDNPEIAQNNQLDSVDIESASDINTPDITQNHVFETDETVSQSYTDEATLGQTHDLPATDIVSASYVSEPSAAIQVFLTSVDVYSTSHITIPDFDEIHNYDGQDLISLSYTTTVEFSQVHNLLSTNTESESTVTQPETKLPFNSVDIQSASYTEEVTLSQNHVFVIIDIESVSSTNPVSITQTHVLESVSIESDSDVSAPSIAQAQNAFARDIVSESYTDTATIGQVHNLASQDLSSDSYVSEPLSATPLFTIDLVSLSYVSEPVFVFFSDLLARSIESASYVDNPSISRNINIAGIHNIAANAAFVDVSVDSLIVENPRSSGIVYQVKDLVATNVSEANSVIDISIKRDNHVYNICKSKNIEPNVSYEILTVDTPVYLNEGDSIISSSANAQVYCSYEIIVPA